jgi:mannose-6-phosphate isomerase-like protein (cupin superfamily)
LSNYLDYLDIGSRFFKITEGLDYEITKEQAIISALEGQCVVKAEGLESLIEGSKTVHMFISPANSTGFLEHTDEVDLVIKCIHGTKGFVVDGHEHTLRQGDSLSVPKGAPHYAVNNKDSVILSIEYEFID